jgi:hypothetical protein
MMLTGTKLFRSVIIAALWIGLWYSSAYAHGGIAGPDELGPPVITATALGIAGYWTMMLWPSGRNKRRTKRLRPDNLKRRTQNHIK